MQKEESGNHRVLASTQRHAMPFWWYTPAPRSRDRGQKSDGSLQPEKRSKIYGTISYKSAHEKTRGVGPALSMLCWLDLVVFVEAAAGASGAQSALGGHGHGHVAVVFGGLEDAEHFVKDLLAALVEFVIRAQAAVFA